MSQSIRIPDRLWCLGWWPVALGALLLCLGCGGGNDDVTRYDVSGTVTYEGQPVSAGSIMFEPDTSKGNKGPAGYAKIRDGKYDTQEEDGMGTVGGPHLVTITGLDASKANPDLFPEGVPLFSDYQTTVDLPEEPTTQDFEVPEDASK